MAKEENKIIDYICAGRRITSDEKLAWYFLPVEEKEGLEPLLFTRMKNVRPFMGLVVAIEFCKDGFIINYKLDKGSKHWVTMETKKEWAIESEMAELRHKELTTNKKMAAEWKKKERIENMTLKEIKAKYGGTYFVNRALYSFITKYLES